MRGKTNFSLQNCRSGREYPSDSIRQVSEYLLGFSWSIGVLMCMILWQTLEVCMEWVRRSLAPVLRFEEWVHFIIVSVKLLPSVKLGEYKSKPHIVAVPSLFEHCNVNLLLSSSSGRNEIEGINSKSLRFSSSPSSLLPNPTSIHVKFTTDISCISSLIYLYFNL